MIRQGSNFRSIRNRNFRSRKANKGAAAIEYAIIAGLIAIAMIATAKPVGEAISRVFGQVQTELELVAPPGEDG